MAVPQFKRLASSIRAVKAAALDQDIAMLMKLSL
jgi:hypothetical protein